MSLHSSSSLLTINTLLVFVPLLLGGCLLLRFGFGLFLLVSLPLRFFLSDQRDVFFFFSAFQIEICFAGLMKGLPLVVDFIETLALQLETAEQEVLEAEHFDRLHECSLVIFNFNALLDRCVKRLLVGVIE